MTFCIIQFCLVYSSAKKYQHRHFDNILLTSLSMKQYHEQITEFDVKAEDVDDLVVIHEDKLKSIMEEAGEAQVVIITVVGPYQVGKSSLIGYLANDKSIATGDGAQEVTTGSIIYGPYNYNDIRVRFNLSVIAKPVLVYFFDTEGICGHRLENSSILNKVLLTEVLSPAVA